MAVKLFVVDDHSILRDLFALTFGAPAREGPPTTGRIPIVVTGTAGTLGEARQLLPRTSAEVILVDHELPDGSGIELAGDVQNVQPAPRIILFTRLRSERVCAAAARAGFDGVVEKRHGLAHLHGAIERVLAGDIVFPARAFRLLVEGDDRGTGYGLTRREREALQALLDLGDAAAASDRLGVAPATFDSHLQRVLTKMGVGSRLAAVSLGLRTGELIAPVAA